MNKEEQIYPLVSAYFKGIYHFWKDGGKFDYEELECGTLSLATHFEQNYGTMGEDIGYALEQELHKMALPYWNNSEEGCICLYGLGTSRPWIDPRTGEGEGDVWYHDFHTYAISKDDMDILIKQQKDNEFL